MSADLNKEKITNDLLRPINMNVRFKAWVAFLFVVLGVCSYAYYLQLRDGLSVTGLGDYTSWGLYIANFVFFVAASLIGMLISSVLGLSGVKWAKPLTRIAEIIALAFAAVAGLVIVLDMGRPERLAYVFMHGRIQSPILWDVTVVITYVVISLLLLYLPMIPDIKLCADRLDKVPKLQRKLYKILSLGWKGTAEQMKLITRYVRILLILIIPVALAIHTVTSWLFASTTRPGWDSTIFGPYFVTGAFVAGVAGVIIAMYFFRNNYKLSDYITDLHFDRMGKLLVMLSLVYLYFNLNEFLVPGYKMKKFDAGHLAALFSGRHALMFWAVQLGGLIIPIILLLFRWMRRARPMLVIAVFVLVGAWFKRYLIVVPTQEHPFLPVQNVPLNFVFYTPTLIEAAITILPFILVMIIITILAKFFPVLPVNEMLEENTE